MKRKLIQPEQLTAFNITFENAKILANKLNHYQNLTPEESWLRISKEILPEITTFSFHLFIFEWIYPNWRDEPETAPVWIPEEKFIKSTHIAKLMAKLKKTNYKDFHSWSANHFDKFWEITLQKLKIVFQKQPQQICDCCESNENPQWLPGAKLNIAESCFTASPDKIALIFQDKNHALQTLSYGELNRLTNRIAKSLVQLGFAAGDAIAIAMPMTKEAVAIYLGIIKMGGIVVSIADSFAPEEIAMRLRIPNAKAIFTQDYIIRNGKQYSLYKKIIAANAPCAIVLSQLDKLDLSLRKDDLNWENFLIAEDDFKVVGCDPMANCNILFSSGTTAEPKAIPWNHTTPIKAASDAFYHHNIDENDVLAWSTNLGWMMGPWLIFAALINRAAIALYTEGPTQREFGQFIEKAQVTMLGVVPTLVANWRQSHCMEGLNWTKIKKFSSTGECSNPEDMLYLMSLAGYQPVIEYCGGTEIGGSYVTSTLIEKNYPSLFSTPALGMNFILIDEKGNENNNGEVALIPPSIGLSVELLNANHHTVYYHHMPKTFDGRILRRHGDQLRRLSNEYYSILGRIDDTMNLNSIKISSAEIERTLVGIEDIFETAAIAVPSHNLGPSHLIIYAATQKNLDNEKIKKIMQEKINQHLNPLFKIHEVIFISKLPKTASNKIMRRVLRKQYEQKSCNNFSGD